MGETQLDPRFAAIIAAATAAAAALNPGVLGVASTVGALLQAATNLHQSWTAGNVTDTDLATLMTMTEANLAAFKAEVEAKHGPGDVA